MDTTYEIRLVIQPEGEAYRARWTQSDGQESEPFSLVLPLTAANMLDVRWYLEEYCQFAGAGDRQRAQGIESKLTEWGGNLYNAVFGTPEGTHIYRNLIDAAADGRENCLLTFGSTDPKLLGQPWEMIRNGGAPLAFRGVTIRRQLVGAGRQKMKHSLDLPLRVLLIVSRPGDVGFIDPRNSIRPMLAALDALTDGQVELDFCEPPTLGRLDQILSEALRDERPYHVVHFDGHGCYMPESGVGALVFERDDAEKSHLVAGTQIGDLLARQAVPLAVLEACRTADVGELPVFGSLAPALLQSGVGSVIAFSHAVHIEASRLLVERFYRELVAGATIGRALGEARVALRANPARWLHAGPDAPTVDLEDWFIPQLYQVGADPALALTKGRRRAKKSSRVTIRKWDEVAAALHGQFPPEPMYRFHGRALELLQLQRAFQRHRAVLLCGGGGMGKTALAREAAAWWLRTGQIDAAVFCSFEQKAGAEQVVQTIGRALEGDRFGRRSADEQWTKAVKLFHDRRVLLVWDNFESTLPIYQQGEPADAPLQFGDDARRDLHRLYRELTGGDPSGRLLVTCRPEETGLPGIKQQDLHGLARPDALHLLAAILDIKNISTERRGYGREGIDALLKLLEDHPLSIELVAPHLKTLKLAEICAEFGRLLDRFKDETALESRNRSLRASLEFSKRHLSQAAQDVLPYLAWFEGGAFEASILAFTQLNAEAWAAIRAELVATALVSVQDVGASYVRFHPTLPYAARAEEVPEPQQAEERFLGVYLGVEKMIHQALDGSRPAAGMVAMAHEEANLRAAMTRVFRLGRRQAGGSIAYTLREYLERAGRLRERDGLIEWVQEQQPDDDALDEAACNAILDHAWPLLTQGRADQAVAVVQGLITRLETDGLAGGADPTFQTALAYRQLGQILVHAHQPAFALESAQKAIGLFENLPGDAARGNVSAALGDLANAYRQLGKLDEALETAERALAIQRDLGRQRQVGAGLILIAAILTEQQRYAEADDRYGEALRAAETARDPDLQGTVLQHQGVLQDETGNHDRAVDLYQKAVTFFQRAGDPSAEMQTCDMLGTAEQERGHLDAAEAWYARSREMALQLKDRYHQAGVAQNLGILYQHRAEETADLQARAGLLRQAVASVQESLAAWIQLENQVHAAASHFQLGVLYRMLAELDDAKKHAQEALNIYESLNLPDVYKVYGVLAAIARDRNDTAAVARWEAKRDAKMAELEQVRWGEGGRSGHLPEELIGAILALAQAVFATRTGAAALPPDAAEALAQLAAAPPPLNDVAAFLQAIADPDAAVPPVPDGLPEKLAEILHALAKAI